MLESIAKDDAAQAGEAGEGRGALKGLDLHELLAHFYRSRWIVGGIFAICLLGALAYTLLATRQYEGRALVEVRQEAEKVLGTESDREGAATKLDSDRFFATQIDIVKSRSVTIAVAESLGFFGNNRFLDAMDVSPDDAKLSILSPQEAKRELIIETMTDHLSVGYTGSTRIVQIVFKSPDPRLSARVANAYAEAYIRNNLTKKSDSSSYALDFLRDQLREAQARLEQSEQESLAYARRTRIVDVSNAAGNNKQGNSTQPQSLIAAQLVQINNAYSEARARRITAEQKWRRVQGVPLLSIPEVFQNQGVQQLLEKRALVEADYREQLAIRQESHPAARQAGERLAELDRQISTVAGDIRRGIRSEYEIAQASERQMKGQLEDLKGNTLTEQNQGIQLSILRREADTNRQQYDALLQRFNQLNAESGVQANNITIIDQAMVDPEPAWPKTWLNILLAVLGAAVLSAAYLLGQALLFDRIRTGADITSRSGLSLLGAIPPSDDVLSDARDAKTAIGEALNVVRTGLSLASADGAPRSIMVTSVQPGEGKTNTCLALAISFARIGKRVVVMDLDLRRPNVHRLFKLQNKLGAANLLSGQAEIAKVIRPSGIDGIDIITAGPIPPNPTELIMSQQLSAIMTELQSSYDIVFIDAPPVLALADAVILSSKVESAIFIIESGRNSPTALRSAVNRIAANGGSIVGGILTKYDPGRMGYGYNLDYSYSYSYAETGQRAEDDAG